MGLFKRKNKEPEQVEMPEKALNPILKDVSTDEDLRGSGTFNLDISDDDEAEHTDENAESRLPAKPPIKKVYVVISVFLIFFSIIGIINSAIFVEDKISAIRERRSLKEEFALFLYPIVINDPPAFDSVNQLQPSTIIISALWKIILTGDMSEYDRDMGVIYIPQSDVENAARSLFGVVTLEHQTVSSHGSQFIHLEQTGKYEIPENPTLFANSPLVTKITNVGEVYTVTVDYIAPSPLAVVGIERKSLLTKTMVYTISRSDDKERNKTVDAIRVDESTEHF